MNPLDDYSSARTTAAVFDLSTRGQIELTGPDAASFLHNLCTNDIKSLQPGRGCEFFLCNHKARVVAHGFAHCLSPQSLLLDMDPGTASKTLKHLNHFVVSEQVEIVDVTGSRALLHVCGPKAEESVRTLVAELPTLENLQQAERIIRHDRLGLQGFDLFCESSKADEWKNSLAGSGVVAAGPETFNILRVEAGVPIDEVDFDSERFVVEIGRIKQAISYAKGCYLGQEPIVMARDRGHANRTLIGVKIKSDKPVQAGTKVTKDGEEVGQVTSCVYSPLVGSAIALAYLKRGNQEPGTEVEAESKKAMVAALPFL